MKRTNLAFAAVLLFFAADGAETLDLGGAWRLENATNGAIACGIDVPGDIRPLVRRRRGRDLRAYGVNPRETAVK